MGASNSSTSPLVGWSKPATRRRQVVLPEPDGPSIEKNSPSRISRLTPSPALTSPKCRWTSLRRTATRSAATDHGDRARDPLVVGHALAALAAGGDGRPPEVDLVEVAGPVRLAALLAEQRVALAGFGH